MFQSKASRFLTFLFAALTLSPASSLAYTVESNIEYDLVDGVSLKMDVYRPSNPGTALRPGIIYTHGGCFSSGSKADIPAQLKAMADDGITVFSVDYRLYPNRYPKGLIDVQQATRFIRKNASRFQVDPNKLGTHGESAGGYLASALGVRTMPDRNGVIDQYSGRVQFVSDWYGRVDFTRTQTTGSDCAVNFLGLARTDANMAKFVEASIHPYVNASSARFHIMHGTHDPQVDPAHSSILANLLWKNSITAMLTYSEGDGHYLSGAQPWKLTRNWFLNSFGIANKTAVTTGNSFQALAVDSGLPEGSLPVDRFKTDRNYVNGFNFNYGVVATQGTGLPRLYDTVRAGDFSYGIPVPVQGVYNLALYFAENQTSVTGAGQRLFNVNLVVPTSSTDATPIVRNLLPDLDIYALAGKQNVLRRNFIQVISRTGNIKFETRSVKGNAILSAFELNPVPY